MPVMRPAPRASLPHTRGPHVQYTLLKIYTCVCVCVCVCVCPHIYIYICIYVNMIYIYIILVNIYILVNLHQEHLCHIHAAHTLTTPPRFPIRHTLLIQRVPPPQRTSIRYYYEDRARRVLGDNWDKRTSANYAVPV